MVTITSIWLLIVLSGVFCWLASALIHMLFKYHNFDYKQLPNEDEAIAVLGDQSPQPALYSMPYCIDMKKMGEQEMQDKFGRGPVALIAVMPNGMPPLGKLLSQQLAFFLFGSLLIAYVASLSLTAGSDPIAVFRLVFVVAFLAYGWAEIPYSIWMGHPWANCLRYLLDAIIYASVTAATFCWLWP